jgi:molybdopterin/thiamine biosynthesis adenylyltransferase
MRETWRAQLFDPRAPVEATALAALEKSGRVYQVHDRIEAQLDELIRAREPAARFSAADLQQRRAAILGGMPLRCYGTWVRYPWSGRLVHVLPREEYQELRTDRNRGKLDRASQQRLLRLRIGVIGLSVGNSAAVTCAMEGVGGAFRLADFDGLGLSNLNRIRAGVQDLGVNKAVIAARQIAEIDPYLQVEIFPGGLTEEAMDDFFDGSGEPIDLLVEECDTPYVKVASREQARARRIPVVMDASDRGLLDIERFDLEPDRPLLHGRLAGIRSQDLHALTVEQSIALIVQMVDPNGISDELAAAVLEYGRTLSSWPQLASAVMLGGAIVTDAARRILLGQRCESGRYYVDLTRLVGNGVPGLVAEEIPA